MKVLLVNKFLFAKGGDAISTLDTGRILEAHGHEVVFWGMDHPDNPPWPFADLFVSHVNYENAGGPGGKARTAMNILYSFEAREKMAALLEKTKPDLVHLNNFAHQLGPSVLDVIKKHGIPTVMTMHDYKMVCPVYTMLCNGRVCEKCKNGRFYHCGLNRCTKGSLFKSMVNVAEMYLHHRMLHIYDKIDLYISPSRFLKNKVEEMGLKGEVAYLPNCVDVSGFVPCFEWREKSIVYVGRLSHEKGVETLIDAVKNIHGVRLKIIGDGPLKANLEEKVKNENIGNVVFLGYRTGQNLHNEIRNSMFLAIPSEWYENSPRVVIEAFALGKPVVGARIGGIPELVQDWETGLTFTSGDVDDLRKKINLMLNSNTRISQLGKNGRAFVVQQAEPTVYYRRLLECYGRARQLNHNDTVRR
ncbi:glycosyltransferase family 4 protein [Desulfosudis oleivorans]|uniref:Glycosyl transferase group 1 n=1 Tax=Desulfosudis oleivorans (strain DSM 6200 / JCM 39069 / Hxd3) TaxID=96561 RepID=A9A0Y3_DESOH|nr:glycosyltransferase family 4 protein [Desulfosudis oleivorans]ABW67608.1 glycosyl transferase group 1 [Desulfosudis oleivorans Hxd3]